MFPPKTAFNLLVGKVVQIPCVVDMYDHHGKIQTRDAAPGP